MKKLKFKNLGRSVIVLETRQVDGLMRPVMVTGIISSIRGMGGHTNIHKYEIKTQSGKHYRNTLSPYLS